MRRPPEDIDPKAEDIAINRRRTRHRAKPEPSKALQAEKANARSRALNRPVSPGIMFEHEGEGYMATSPHSDADLWELQIADAFATRSLSVMRSFIHDLKALCSMAWDRPNGAWKPNETELNSILAMVADVRPRSIAEAALAAQMVAVHLLTMRLAAKALNQGHMVLERDAALTGKLARTYVMQLEALQGIRGKRRTSRQTITVKKELNQSVHYHDHRGSEENERQPHEPTAITTGERGALPCDEPRGRVLRLPSRER